MRLKDKVAIITGGGSGIGKAIAGKFKANGAFVHILDLNKGQETDTIRFHVCDVSDHQQVHDLIGEILKKRPVDILVNNAGIGFVGNLMITKEEDIDKLFNINVKGVYNCMHASVPSMVENGGGVILNMASVAATVGIPDRFAAC